MMASHVHNTDIAIEEIKVEPTEFAVSTPKLSYGYSRLKTDDISTSDVIKKEEYESPRMTVLNLNAIAATQTISNADIARDDIKIKLDHGDNRESCEELKKKNYKCKFCTKSLATKHILSNHMKLHTGERNHKCEICPKRFTTKQILSNHLRVHTRERNYECAICAKHFTTKHILSKHVKTHTAGRNFRCEICTKGFTTKQNLLSHAKGHTGERNYKCEICAKRFVRKHVLSNHAKLHTGERNHKCEVCGKRFPTKTHLSHHVKVHTGERNYKCAVCGKAFSRKQHLSNHVKRHTGESNYKCEICTKHYTTKHILRKHLKIHTGERKKRDLSRHKKGYSEKIDEEKISCKVPSIKSTAAVLVKEEIPTFISEGKLEIKNDTTSVDTTQRKPSSNTNETRADLWQILNNEVIIKEEKI